jgi:hypothetical protein
MVRLSDHGATNSYVLFIGLPSARNNVPWTTDLSTTSSLFDYDVLVVNMKQVFNPNLLVAPIGLIDDKRFEAEKLLAKGGIIVCLIAPEVVPGILDLKKGSYDWIPVPGLGNVVMKGTGQRIKRVKANPFDSYLDLPGVIWYAYLNQSQKVKYEILAKNEGDFAVAARMDVGDGAIYLLPFSLNTNWMDMIYECLEKAWKKGIERREPPAWLASIKVPEQEEILQRLSEVDSKIKELVEQHRRISIDLEQKLEILKLLYEQGTPLELAVKSGFKELGYKLEKQGDRDLVFDGQAQRVVFEVTGSTGAIELSKIRQLLDFIMDEEKKSSKTPKGVLVGNHEIEKLPSERGVAFTQAVVERAKAFGICLLPSQKLFEVILQFRQRGMDPEQFWKDLIATKGIYQPEAIVEVNPAASTG